MFLALIAFVVTFLVTRLITRMIRAGKGPFQNVSAGGTHIHHVIPGLVILLIGGILALGSGEKGLWRQIAGLMFGIGAALVLDEFAMILHLDDVYWSNEGRLSADAVTLAAVVLFSALLVVAPNQPNPDEVTGFWLNFVSGVTFVVMWLVPIVMTLLKGKLWLGALALAVIPVAWVAAVRLARPGSPWAHSRYKNRPEKLAKAERRAQKWERLQRPVRAWIQTHIFGLSQDTAKSE
jgi:hypothetical protein